MIKQQVAALVRGRPPARPTASATLQAALRRHAAATCPTSRPRSAKIARRGARSRPWSCPTCRPCRRRARAPAPARAELSAAIGALQFQSPPRPAAPVRAGLGAAAAAGRGVRLARRRRRGWARQVLLAARCCTCRRSAPPSRWSATRWRRWRAPRAPARALVFGYLGGAPLPFAETSPGASFILFFQALPLVLVVGALSAVLYHWRVLPAVVALLARGLRRAFGLSRRLQLLGRGERLRRHGRGAAADPALAGAALAGRSCSW